MAQGKWLLLVGGWRASTALKTVYRIDMESPGENAHLLEEGLEVGMDP